MKLKAFANDSFDANRLRDSARGRDEGPDPHADRFASDLAIILSVLEPAQREKLGAPIEERPAARIGKPVHGAKLDVRVNAR